MTEFVLSVDPAEKVVFGGPFASPVSTELKIKNGGEESLAYKVKCTDNSLFRIRPVVGLLKKEEESTVNLTVTCPGGTPPTKAHHFVVVQTDAPDDAANARSVWEAATGKENPTKRLSVGFEEEKGGEEAGGGAAEGEGEGEGKEDADGDKKEGEGEEEKKEEE